MVRIIRQSIIFDSFNKPDFEQRIVDTISQFHYVQNIKPCDSRRESGLKLVDNICSVVRLHICNSDSELYYDVISDSIKEV